MSTMRQRAVEGLQAGDDFVVRRTFTRKEMLAFGDLSRDYNPIHHDERFAAAKNMSGTILHGLLVAGMLTEIGGQIGWLASRMDFRFRRPVYAGDTVECRLTITDVSPKGRARALASYRNQLGQTVIEARLEGIVPQQSEREVMAAMLAEGDPTNGRTT